MGSANPFHSLRGQKRRKVNNIQDLQFWKLSQPVRRCSSQRKVREMKQFVSAGKRQKGASAWRAPLEELKSCFKY